jgi:aryl-alcohol dehydrogenase-like predicted oxidoreductase
MEQRQLGRTGLAVSALGFGCGAVGGLMVRGEPAEQRRAVERALDAGITYFDTAPGYGDGASETNLGRVLNDLRAWDRVVVGTKVRLTQADVGDLRTAIRRSIETSLGRLGHDHVDVLHLHNQILFDTFEPGGGLGLRRVLGDVAPAFRDVVGAGLARHTGITGLGEVEALLEVLRAEPFETVQAYFNVLNPSAGYTGHGVGQQDFAGLIDAAARDGAGVIVIRVLAAGAATGSPDRPAIAGDPGSGLVAGANYERDRTQAAALAPIARDAGLEGSLELAVRFGLSKAGVSTVLVGYSTYDHLESAIRWAERGPLPDDVVRRVLELAA